MIYQECSSLAMIIYDLPEMFFISHDYHLQSDQECS